MKVVVTRVQTFTIDFDWVVDREWAILNAINIAKHIQSETDEWTAEVVDGRDSAERAA